MPDPVAWLIGGPASGQICPVVGDTLKVATLPGMGPVALEGASIRSVDVHQVLYSQRFLLLPSNPHPVRLFAYEGLRTEADLLRALATQLLADVEARETPIGGLT